MSNERRYRQYVSRGGTPSYKEWISTYGETPSFSTRKVAMFILLVLIAVIFFSSCGPAKYGYGKARITLYKGKVSVKLLERLKEMPDTTIEAIIITPKQ